MASERALVVIGPATHAAHQWVDSQIGGAARSALSVFPNPAGRLKLARTRARTPAIATPARNELQLCQPDRIFEMNPTADVNLPTPNFAFTPPLRCVAGLRPFRSSGYRLERERPAASPGKLVVHNYGHGGAGITLSWGAASEVRDIVRDHLATSSDRSVAVLGSGVMGLTAATRLLELGLRVTIYAEKFWTETTSAVAGGQWSPSIVNYSDERQFKEVLKISYETFEASIGQGFGVSKRANYTPTPSDSLDKVLRLLPGLLPARITLPRLPFEHHTQGGFVYQTLLIEPPIFLKRLDGDLRANNVAFVSRTFSNPADVQSLPENIIVNCTGLGAKKIWNDQSLAPLKGQLALLSPQEDLKYLYSRSGYLFPRADAVVIGGSIEDSFDTPDPEPAFCKQMVDHMKSLFGLGPAIPLPERHIHHPRNLPSIAAQEVAGV